MKLVKLLLIVTLAWLLLGAGGKVSQTFEGVDIGGQVVTIEASAKKAAGGFTTCRYFSPGWVEYLGAYDAPSFQTGLLDFCVANFDLKE